MLQRSLAFFLRQLSIHQNIKLLFIRYSYLQRHLAVLKVKSEVLIK